MLKKGERLEREFRHVLRRCPMLTDAECRLLAIVGSYEHGCLMGYDQICALTGFSDRKPRKWHRSKLKRTIRSLVDYGLLERTYGRYKRVKLRIAHANFQSEFANQHNGSPLSHQSQTVHEPLMVHQETHDGAPVSQPILERELKRKLKTVEIENSGSGERVPTKAGDVSIFLRDAIKAIKRI